MNQTRKSRLRSILEVVGAILVIGFILWGVVVISDGVRPERCPTTSANCELHP
jgi:hypothetical protein